MWNAVSKVIPTINTGLNPIDLTVIAVYLALMIFVAVNFARYMKSTKDLFTAGSNAPWWVSGLSLYITIFSAGTLVAWGSIAYVFGWIVITIQWIITV